MEKADNRRLTTPKVYTGRAGNRVKEAIVIVSTEPGSPSPEYILGIDLGTNSVGWAAIGLDSTRKPVGILDAGVRIFAAGTNGDIASGRDESRNLKRRDQRQLRRQTWRQARRRTTVFRILQRAGLLPLGESVHEVITALDQDLISRLEQQGVMDRTGLSSKLPYVLRARALDYTLTAHELGRALYHLAERRGFQSNRKASPKRDEEEGKVKQAISELNKTMVEEGARTLGEHFARLNPHQDRIRRQWTSRTMYEAEFEAIWAAQAACNPSVLTKTLHDKLRKAIFFQRPLKSQSGLVGTCELEPGRRRAPKALLEAQRFRILQTVNNMAILNKSTIEERRLFAAERQDLFGELDRFGDCTFAQARKRLHLGKEWTFNFEATKKDTIGGNTTSAQLRKVFGDRWDQLSEDDKHLIVDDVRSMVNDKALCARGQSAWKLDEASAQRLAKTHLEAGYLNLSRQAISKVMPYMEEGLTFPEARKRAYPDADSSGEPHNELPQLTSAPIPAVASVRNPVVARSLTELRRVVNAVTQARGKPTTVRVELARDLKRSRNDREKITKQNTERERTRRDAAAKARDAGVEDPTRADEEKWLLGEECGWICPYTGRSISARDLFGGAIDVEHIIPYAQSFDDSFANKTLCWRDENDRKGRRSPHTAYAHTPQWEEILDRVRRFPGLPGYRKWQRFQWDDAEITERFSNFSDRQLNDTRYASRLAADYLGLLYGGQIDAGRTRRVQVGAGQVTARLRDAWNLNGILHDGGVKTRDDHRHHAVDAVVIALSAPATIQALSRAAATATRRLGGGISIDLTPPWPALKDDVQAAVERIVPSHRVSRRVRGPLHAETLYGKAVACQATTGSYETVRHVRKSVTAPLTCGEVERIVDPAVRHAVQAKIEAVGGDPRKLTDNDPPTLATLDGRFIPIRRVRISDPAHSVVTIGVGSAERFVKPGGNHHVEIFKTIDSKGDPKWCGRVVTLLEATRRRSRKEPIVSRRWDGDSNAQFLFSLVKGDTIRNEKGVFMVRKFSGLTAGAGVQFGLVGISDARGDTDVKAANALWRPHLGPLLATGCEKIDVDPLGRIRRAND